MIKDEQIRVNKFGDHAAFGVHGLLYAGILGGVTFAVASPVISAIAVGMTLALNFGLVPLIKNAFRDALPEEEKSDFRTAFDRASGRPPEIREKVKNTFEKMKEFAEKLGIKETPSFHYMDDDYGARQTKSLRMRDPKTGTVRGELREWLKLFLRTEFNKYANAAAFSHDKGSVILTEPLAENLEQDEIDAVTAHEVGHLAAHHSMKKGLLGFLGTPARMTTSLFSLVTAFASFKNIGLVVAGGMVGEALSSAYSSVAGLDPEHDAKDKAKVQRLKNVFQDVAVMGLGAVFGAPDLVLARGLAFGTREATTLLGKSYSRCNEYQADRLAAELTRRPMSLVSGLDKAMEHNISFEKGMDFGKPKEKGGLLSAVFDRAKQLYRTHPTNAQRRAQMEKMELCMQGTAP